MQNLIWKPLNNGHLCVQQLWHMLLDVTFSNKLILLSKVRLMASFNTSKIWCPFFIIINPHTKHSRSIASTCKSVDVIFIFLKKKEERRWKQNTTVIFPKKNNPSSNTYILFRYIFLLSGTILLFYSLRQVWDINNFVWPPNRESALKFARALIISKYFHDRRRAF